MPANYPTLMDVARRSGNASVRKVIEALSKSHEGLDDIPWIQCNSTMKHVTTVRTGLPDPAWRMLNAGVGKGKSQTKQVEVGCGMLESYAEVDKKLIALAAKNGSQEAADDFLETENRAFYQGFANKAAEAMFYGDPADPRQPVGFINYYNSLSGNTKDNVISCGGSAANKQCSVWLICWDELAAHGIYPAGSTAGFKVENLGEHTVDDGNGGQFQAYRTHYSWDLGFVQRDWRTAVRICNIDVDKLKAGTAQTNGLIEAMVKALYQLPNEASGYRKAFYAPKEVAYALHIYAMNKATYQIGLDDIGGKKVTALLGVPIRREDALKTTEAVVA